MVGRIARADPAGGGAKRAAIIPRRGGGSGSGSGWTAGDGELTVREGRRLRRWRGGATLRRPRRRTLPGS